MTHKIINFIFVISLAFGITIPNQIKALPSRTQVRRDVPFDVNKDINQVIFSHFQPPNSQKSDPLILTGEFLIDTCMTYGSARDNQEHPSIAFDGTNYLVVWQDRRSGSSFDIYGARINQQGCVLDKTGIAISTAINHQSESSIAFDGNNYLVVWKDDRSYPYSDIYGVRINQDGIVLDTSDILISFATSIKYDPSVAFDGTNYFVVWQDYRSGYPGIYGARVNQGGVVIDSNGFDFSNIAFDPIFPSITFNGTNYLVVWEELSGGGPNICGVRVNYAGEILDSNGIAISTATNGQYHPCVVSDGMDYFVFWEDERCGTYLYNIYGARVNQAGIVLDTNGIAVSIQTNEQYYPSVAFDGTNYLVVWVDIRSGDPVIYGARVNRSGIVIDSSGIEISNAANLWGTGFPSVAFNENNYLVVWGDNRNIDGDIYGAQVDQTGIVIDSIDFVVSSATNSQGQPSVAFDGSNYLVVWEEYRYSSYDIIGLRLNEAGVILDSNCFPISAVENDQISPSVTFDGTNYLIVWEDKRKYDKSNIYGARVNQLGVVLDPNGIPITIDTNSHYSPSVAFDGTNYFVVWEDNCNGYYLDIYGTRVSPAGNVLDPNGFPVSTAARHQRSPNLAFDGTNYLVVWDDERFGSLTHDIYGARVSQAGIVLDPDGIAISTAENGQKFPAIAFDGLNYLMIWEDWRNGSYDIYGARVSPASTVLDPNGIVISTSTNDQLNPTITFDGANYLVVWEESHRVSSTIVTDIYGAKVSPSCVLIDSFVVSTQEGIQKSPTLAHGSGSHILITYSGWTSRYQGKDYNTMRIWGKFYPFVPGIAKENSKVKMPSANLLEVYPNPAKNVMRVRGPLNIKTIKIFDICGKMIREIASTASQSRNDGAVEISLKGINPGIYFLRVGKETKKFIVTR